MDTRDWILIPNHDAVRNADHALLRAMLDVQAVVEPDKRNPVERRVEEAGDRAEDEEGQGGGVDPPPHENG
ncbi:MAG: hypothetical protein R2762_16470 [Bryobacteraceae bacterium]